MSYLTRISCQSNLNFAGRRLGVRGQDELRDLPAMNTTRGESQSASVQAWGFPPPPLCSLLTRM